MRYEIFKTNLKSLLKQRNILFPLCLILSLTQFVSVVCLFIKKERIVIVPAVVDRTFWVDSNKVSLTYLEQMGLFLSQLILSKSYESASKQREIVLRHTYPKFYGVIKNFLIEEEEHLKKENGSYQFYPVATEVLPNKNIVILTGERIGMIGQRIVSKEREKYSIHFKYTNGKLYLSGFTGEKL